MRRMALFVSLFVSINSWAQSVVQGIVKNESGEAIASATVQINGQTTLTNEGGFYTLSTRAGAAKITASAVGCESFQKNVTMQEGKEQMVNIVLNEAVKELQAVEIIGRKETGYKNSTSFSGTKTATPLKEVPQAISYATKELMQDQQAIRLGDIVKNFSGVNQFTFYDDITIRGFRVSGGEGGVQLINGMRTTTGFWKQSLTNYLERVEVIKGPASALFGNTSPGGTINRVTKKPLQEKRQSLSFTTGSFNTLRALADFTGPMNEEKTLLYRLNLGYENSGSFRDLQFDKNMVIAPSISFLPTAKTRFNFDLVYNKSNSRLDRGQAVFGNNDIYSVPTSKSLNQVNDYLNEENFILTTSLNHKFSERLQFNLAYVKTGYEEDLLEHRSANTYAKDSAGAIIPTLVEMQVFNRKRKRYVDNASAFLTYDFKLGATTHKFLAGMDYSQERQPFGGSQLQARGYRNHTNTGAANYNPAQPTKFLYETVNGVKRPVPNVPHFDLTAASPYALQDMSKYFYNRVDFDPTFNSLNGFYVQDQIKLGNLQALIGLRYETFSDKTNYLKPAQAIVKQNAFIPRFGLVYSVSSNVNLYGTYAKGYNPQTASTVANPLAGGPFDPLYSSLVEFGAKSEWFNKRLAVTTSIYQIELRNVLYNAGVAGQPDLLRQIGKETAKGFEFEATGQINPNWNLIVAYAYNDAAISESTKPEEIGRQKPNAPKQQGSFWTKYSFSRGNLSGLGFGLGGNFVTGRNVSLSQTQTLPGYALLNAAVYYRVNKFQLQVNMNNLLDKTYWVGGYDYLRLFPGAPRNYLASVAYTF
ncbi:MAG TPA: TonB-dependent siderophore receptor [Flavisolibacter sp.]|nr:TonB-dependent siderophore receptor [Flavisolibacter sp.]